MLIEAGTGRFGLRQGLSARIACWGQPFPLSWLWHEAGILVREITSSGFLQQQQELASLESEIGGWLIVTLHSLYHSSIFYLVLIILIILELRERCFIKIF